MTCEGPGDLEAGGGVGARGGRAAGRGLGGTQARWDQDGQVWYPDSAAARECGVCPLARGAEEPPPPPRTPAGARRTLPTRAGAAGGVDAQRASGMASAPAEPSAAERAARAGCARPRARAPPPEGRARAGPRLPLSRARRPPAAPRPGRRVPRSTRGGAAPPPPLQVPGAGTWVGRGARGPRTGGARGPGGGGADTSSAQSWAGCGVAEGSATPQVPLGPQGDADLAAAFWQRGAPGEVSRTRSQSFCLLTLLDLALTCEANPGR